MAPVIPDHDCWHSGQKYRIAFRGPVRATSRTFDFSIEKTIYPNMWLVLILTRREDWTGKHSLKIEPCLYQLMRSALNHQFSISVVLALSREFSQNPLMIWAFWEMGHLQSSAHGSIAPSLGAALSILLVDLWGFGWTLGCEDCPRLTPHTEGQWK